MPVDLPPRLSLRPRAALLACLLLLLLAPARAGAVISDPRLLDSSADVVDVGDAAMSEDGSGGVVWLRRVDGRNRVFAAAFRNGGWGRPQRVDVGQSFDSSWPRIGAGDGGRLVVAWVQELGVESDRLFSATMDPGATGFQEPVPVDLNVGEATSTYPDLAMARGGQAYLVYRVVTDVSPANPPGYVGADLRVARYNSRLWSVLGAPVDRNLTAPVRAPGDGNAPQVGIDVQGNGVVAWQEPDDEFVDRIWARRIFGSSFGIPLRVSPTAWEGVPLRGPADAFALDVAGFGQAAVAFRQQPGQASTLTAARTMVNEMPEVFVEGSGSFAEARLADGEPRGGLGRPSVAVEPRGAFEVGFAAGGASLLAAGDDASAGRVVRLDDDGGAIAEDPLVDLAETGAALAAWRELRGGAGLVGAMERRADGVAESALLSAPRGGAVGRIVLGGSGLGDGLIAWKQGEGEGAQVAAAIVDAPPDPFLVLLPDGWQRGKRIPIAWDHAPNAIGGVRYSVSVDDEPVVEGRRGLRAALTDDDVGDGRHRVQIFAVDAGGQETGSRTGRLLVDRRGPRVRLRRQGRRLVVRVDDGPARRVSGLRRGSVRVSFGGARRARTGAATARRPARKPGRRRASTVRVVHDYARPGRFRVVVRARHPARNLTKLVRKVKVR